MADWVLAIDFGTTTTSAAMGVGTEVDVVEIDGAARMPSVVMAADSGGLVVGSAAEAQLALAPERAERTPKRRLGDEVMLLGDRPVRPVEAVAAILAAISAEAIRRQGGVAPVELRLTHPARWGSLRRQKLAEAAQLAGLPEPVFVPEPVAAAVHFLDERIDDGTFVAVYDLGGGTFDTAVLRRSGDGFDVVGLPGGDELLGGEVFDERLFALVGSQIAAEQPDAWENLRFSSERSWRKVGHDLRLEVRRAKEALSANTEYTIYVGAPVDTTVLVTRDELEDLIHADVVSTVEELAATVERSGVAIDDLAAVNLTGGSSRIPLVTRLVAERFGQLPQTWGDPKAAVALGAVKATRLTSVTTGSGSTSTARVASVALPERIGGHEVIAELGRGGMGVVYLARQTSVGRPVAVKTIPVLDPNLTDRLQREAAVLAELQHPNIATVIDVGTDERGTYVVMPYFQGGTVAHVLDRSGPMSPGEAATVLAPVATALAATHDKGFLHRDVKPSNVLLSDGGDPYLADFGLALPMLDSSRLSNSRAVLGTAPYTAPEILADEPASPAADTYALGVMGYQLLTGTLPYAGSNVLAVLDAVRRSEPTPIAERAPDAPASLVSLVMAAFAADPADRPQDLRAWAAAVRASVEAEPVRPAPPVAWAAAIAGAPVAPSAPVLAAAGDDAPTGPAEAGSGERDAAAVDTGRVEPATTPGDDHDPVVPVPSQSPRRRRFAFRPNRVLSGAAAAVLLLVVVGVVLAGGGDGDRTQVELVDSAGDTTSSTTERTETSQAGKVEVPDLLGAPAPAAAAALRELGFTVSVAERASAEPEGTVLEMSPGRGSKVDKGTKVALIVAAAPGDDVGTPSGSTGGAPLAPSSGETASAPKSTSGHAPRTSTATSPPQTSPPQTAPPETSPPQTSPPQTSPPQTSPPQTEPPPPNNPPVASHTQANPDTYDFCRGGTALCNLGWYEVWMLQTAFADAEGDAWAYHTPYDAQAQYGYVTFSTSGDCSSRAGGACVRYTPTEANATSSCYSDWVVFSAYDPSGSGRESNQYWLQVWVNC